MKKLKDGSIFIGSENGLNITITPMPEWYLLAENCQHEWQKSWIKGLLGVRTCMKCGTREDAGEM